jgi:toxin ParE1/3/4
MAIEVKWTPHSIENIDAIAEFISRDSIHFAQVEIERFFDRTKILNSFPEAGRIVPEIGQSNIGE